MYFTTIQALENFYFTKLTIEQILKIEPALIEVQEYAKMKNEEAKHKEIHWHNVWAVCKKMQYNLIGDEANKGVLKSSVIWDQWHDHLYKLTENCL